MGYRELELVLQTGDLTGMISARMKNSSIRLIKIPETELKSIPSMFVPDENGICLLFSGAPKANVCISHAQHIVSETKRRLSGLKASYPSETWPLVLICLMDKCTPVEAAYVTQRLTELIQAAKVAKIVATTETPHSISVSPQEMASLDMYVSDIKVLFGVLQCNVFKKASSTKHKEPQEPVPVPYEIGTFYAKKPSADALAKAEIPIHLGHTGARKAVVKAGSRISDKVTNYKGRQTVLDRRMEEQEKGRLKNRIVLEDISFTSQSAAASFVLGNSSNGNDEWKTEDGKTLKEFLE